MSAEERISAVTARYDGDDGEAAQLTVQALARLAWRRRHGGKVCSMCDEVKPVSSFGRDVTRRDGLAHRCKECNALLARARRALPNPGPLLQ